MDKDKNKEEDQAHSEKNVSSVKGDTREIDLIEIAYKIWSRKKLILVWAIWGVIAGLVIAYSIPKEYTTVVTLAPETKGSGPGVTGGLGALASMAGIPTSAGSGSDAVYPSLYPEIVGSVPFITSLFDVPVKDTEGREFTVREYVGEDLRKPWWSYIPEAPGKLISVFKDGSDKNGEDKTHVVDNFKLTPRESMVVGKIRGRISATVDQKTNVITIQAIMQDPMVSAILADTVVARLREYVTNYRTNKARQDLEYVQTLNAEAQQEYYKAQQRLADYIDRNQNLATRSAQVTRDRLENEASLAFNLYNETSLQVQSAKSRVQEITPVYTEITPATVPMRPTSPKRGLIIGGCAFLAVVGCIAWLLFGSPIVDQFKKKE